MSSYVQVSKRILVCYLGAGNALTVDFEVSSEEEAVEELNRRETGYNSIYYFLESGKAYRALKK